MQRYWRPFRQRKIYATSSMRRMAFTTLLVALIGPTIAALAISIASSRGQQVFRNPFQDGNDVPIDPIFRNTGSGAIWTTALLAHLSQPLLALLYYAYNSLYTALYLAVEWDAYGSQKKGLRVSCEPRGCQRSAHFLQLPLRYGVPLAMSSALVHWLASESVFVVSLSRAEDKDRSGDRFIGCDFSPTALALLLANLLLLLAVFLIGVLPRFKNGIPVAGSCSAAIAAACHAHFDREPSTNESADPSQLCSAEESCLADNSILPLSWGVVESGRNGEVRCAFTPNDVFSMAGSNSRGLRTGRSHLFHQLGRGDGPNANAPFLGVQNRNWHAARNSAAQNPSAGHDGVAGAKR